MPDSSGLSLWSERNADYQLEMTLKSFTCSRDVSCRSPTTTSSSIPSSSSTELWKKDLKNIKTVEQLALRCRTELLKLAKRGRLLPQQGNSNNSSSNNNNNNNSKLKELKQSDANANNANESLWKNPTLLQSLSAFLPSSLGFRCLQLAVEAVERVESGRAKATYVHRGSVRGEKWLIDMQSLLLQDISSADDEDANENELCWKLDVDCAGYVRNVIKSISGSDLLVSLSDRDYMRAKDFFTFFERLEYTSSDIDRLNPADDEDIMASSTLPQTTTMTTTTSTSRVAANNNGKQAPQQQQTRSTTTNTTITTTTATTRPVLKWCRVDDVRSVIAGDIIVYRAKGGAAGGSVFTKKDCMRKALMAVKTAEMYDIVDGETGDQPVDINVAKLPEVRQWVEDVMDILQTVGIEEIDQLRGDNGGENDEDNDDNLQAAISILEREEKLSENTVSLLQEVLRSRNGNTGHIMFAAGPAEEMPGEAHIWRVPVYHSTGVGPKKKRGIQRAYKRFEYSPQYQKWTRGGARDDVEGGHIEVVVGRMCV